MTEDSGAAELAALWRAMPVARLLDCGMRYGDVMRLETQTARGASWVDTAAGIADDHAALAQGQLADGHQASAADSLRAAVAALQFAQMPLPDGDRKRSLYRRIAETLTALAVIPRELLERVEVPYGAETLVGWVVRPVETPVRGVVIVFGGQSGWGSCYLRAAAALARRGLTVILAEGPGQGESRLFGGSHLDGAVATGFSRFVDVAEDIAPGSSVGVWGNSMGGLFAALLAARDDRVGACCVNGGFAAPRLLPFRTFREQAAAMMGTDDPVTIQDTFDSLAFSPRRDRIGGNLLVVHGGADLLVSLEDQRPFLSGAREDSATLRIWPDGDHTVYNRGDERNAYVADWFADCLLVRTDRS